MRTRAKAAASHCIVTRAPVEILTSILKYGCIGHKDLRSIAGTCRYLRAVANPLLFKEMSFVLERVASLDVLQGMRTQPDKANLVESLSIRAKSNLTPLQAGRYGTIVAASLGHLANLTTISIPFALLSEAVFDFIYGHPTIATLSLSRVVKSQSANAIAFHSSVVRPFRSSPLKVPVVVLDSTNHVFSQLFLLFLRRHSICFPRVEFIAYDPMPTFLTAHRNRMPSLDWLLILAAPVAFQRTFGCIPRLAQAQSTLKHIDLDFVAFGPNETFELDQAWPTWQVGTGLVPIGSTAMGSSFVDAWRGIKLTEVKMMSMKLDDAYPSLAADYDWDDGERAAPWLRLDFAPGTVLPINAIRALSEELFWVNMFVISSQVGWEDWNASVRSLAQAGGSMQTVEFRCSFTPTPTVSTTVACSSACETKLAKTHPALVLDAELVGGYLAVWDIAYRLNLTRFKKASAIITYLRGHVSWVVDAKGEIVDVSGSLEPTGRWSRPPVVWERDEYALVSTADKVKDCFCFRCGEVKGDDPMTALKKCPVDEVRNALQDIGFDLDAFDERAPSEPVDPSSLETFLRSSSA